MTVGCINNINKAQSLLSRYSLLQILVSFWIFEVGNSLNSFYQHANNIDLPWITKSRFHYYRENPLKLFFVKQFMLSLGVRQGLLNSTGVLRFYNLGGETNPKVNLVK